MNTDYQPQLLLRLEPEAIEQFIDLVEDNPLSGQFNRHLGLAGDRVVVFTGNVEFRGFRVMIYQLPTGMDGPFTHIAVSVRYSYAPEPQATRIDEALGVLQQAALALDTGAAEIRPTVHHAD